MHDRLSGLETFSVVVEGHIDGTFQKLRYLEEIVKIQRFLEQHEAFDFTLSFVDYLSLLNSAVNETGEPELPGDDEVIDSLSLFFRHKDIRPFVSPDFSRASIVVRHSTGSFQCLRTALDEVRRYVAENIDPDLDVRMTGGSILNSNAADAMVAGQARSLLLMLLVVFAVISLLFVNVRAGLIALVPNLFPIVVLFGVMGAAGIPLDTGTAMIAAIALGICVDHTIHFMVRYNKHLRSGHADAQAMR